MPADGAEEGRGNTEPVSEGARFQVMNDEGTYMFKGERGKVAY
jgi:hypothetical protein